MKRVLISHEQAAYALTPSQPGGQSESLCCPLYIGPQLSHFGLFIRLFTEEHSISLPTYYRANVARRIGFFRIKEESVLLGRPFDRRPCLDEIPGEVLCFIDYCRATDFAAPLDIEGNCRRDGSYWWYGRITQPVSVRQVICKIMKVWDSKIRNMERCPGTIQFNPQVVWVNRNGPKQSTSGNRWRVVMNLLRYVRRSDRTGVNVQSYESKGSLMLLPVLANVLALHEAKICLKCQCWKTFSPTRTTDAVQPYETFEIRYL